MISVSSMNPCPSSGFIPVMNMWCPYTTAESAVTVHMAYTEPRYQFAGLRLKKERTSLTIPQAGRMRM